MLAHPDICYQALISRDARFDGRVFVGVTSTGIYCRPICRVRTPRAENCRFFPNAAAAEAAGFRPCLRCRPELAPGVAAVDAGARLARRVATLLETGGEGEMRELAQRLEVSERHLRRVFSAHYGVTPAAFQRTSRLLLAKRLLAETRLPVTEIAYAAGFASVRTFEHAFAQRYGLAANTARRADAMARTDPAAGVALELGFRPPLDWTRLLRFLARRSVLGVESVDATAYRRSVRLTRDGRSYLGWVEATFPEGAERITVRVSPELVPVIPEALARMRHVLDLDCVSHDVEAALGALAATRPGLRVPGCFDGFEMSVRAVLGQQISVAAAATLAGRFAAAFGEAIATPWESLARVFPTAERIAATDPSAIAALGIAPRRAAAIVSLAQALADGSVELSPHADVPGTVSRLQALPGIGPWTAEYIALRALRWPDAFPGSDLGVRMAMGGVTEAEARRRAEAWRPWRAYAVIHLWTGLEEGS